MDRYEFNRKLAEAAREMAEEVGTDDTLQRAVTMATDLVPHCDLAGLSLVHPQAIDTPAASHGQPRIADELQYELGEGPCLDALPVLGALNLYAKQVDAFDHEDVLDGLVVAAHAAVALAATLEQDHLRRALDTRRMIGEATGILRERFGLTTDQALSVLKRVSADTNTKLHRVAHRLVDTGDIDIDLDESPA